MHWYDGWGMGWMMLWGSIFWLLVIAGLGWLLFKSSGAAMRPEEPPEAILKRRYARGDIDREEYQRRLHDLRA